MTDHKSDKDMIEIVGAAEPADGAGAVGEVVAAAALAWPSPAWTAAFHAQATPATMTAAARTAEVELRTIEPLAIDATLTPEDVVQHIVTSTLSGKIAWPAATITLRAHLRDKIRKLGRRLRQRQHADLSEPVLLDAFPKDHPIWSDDGLHAPGELDEQVGVSRVARRVEQALTLKLHRDPVALRILALMPHATTVRDLAAESGLPAATVRAAKVRIQRAASKLGRPLRAAVREVLPFAPSTHDGELSSSTDSEP